MNDETLTSSSRLPRNGKVDGRSAEKDVLRPCRKDRNVTKDSGGFEDLKKFFIYVEVGIVLYCVGEM